jgi:hypothetical protein
VVDLYVSPDSGSTNKYSIQHVELKKLDSTGKPQTDKPQEISFVNEFKMAEIKISKTVKGTAYAADEAFDFYVMIPVGGDSITLANGQEIHAEIWNATEKVEDVTLYVKGEKTDKDNLSKDVANVVHLKDGQTLKITAPVSMIYYVQEVDYSSEGYVTTWKYTEAGTLVKDSEGNIKHGTTFKEEDGEAATDPVVAGTTNTTTNKVEFTNSREQTVDSGIVLDVMPYAIVMAIAVAGAVFFIVKKRNAR